VQEAQILPPTSAKPPAPPHHTARHIAREILETLGLTLVIFLAIHFSIQPYRIVGPSMQPGLHTDELVLVNLLSYRFGTPQRGDVIVFHPPITTDQSTYLIKRIIAIPGDTVSISATAVYVDGKKLDERYISPLPPDGVETVTGIVSNLKMQPDQYWVMGDNRRDSTDSRSFGVVTRANIVGKVEIVMWPLNSLEGVPTYSGTFSGVVP
jgi:signal peptidase I